MKTPTLLQVECLIYSLLTGPNPFCDLSESCKSKLISLTQGKFAIVDEGDFAKESKYKWSAVKMVKRGEIHWYAVRKENVGCRKKQRTIYMHREILGLKRGDGIKTDHRNGNSLDNRRCNLRRCDIFEISCVRQKHKTRKGKECSSHYKGVSQCRDRWRADIQYKKKVVHLGRFDDEIDAARAYDRAALKYFGEFAVLNTNPIDCKKGISKRESEELRKERKSHRKPRQKQKAKEYRFTSSYKGVSLETVSGGWRAELRYIRKLIYLGCFYDELDAAKAYDRAALKYYGESAILNTNPIDCQEGAPSGSFPAHKKTVGYESWMDGVVADHRESPFSRFHPLHKERIKTHCLRVANEERLLIAQGIDPREGENSAYGLDRLKEAARIRLDKLKEAAQIHNLISGFTEIAVAV